MTKESGKIEIMVLDDEDIVCSRLKPILVKSGYVVEAFTDSQEAKKRLEEHEFDILVTDLKMANLSGMEIFQFAHQKWPDLDVVMISGFATVDITREALKAGVRDIIPKPFKISQLKEVINKIAGEKSIS